MTIYISLYISIQGFILSLISVRICHKQECFYLILRILFKVVYAMESLQLSSFIFSFNTSLRKEGPRSFLSVRRFSSIFMVMMLSVLTAMATNNSSIKEALFRVFFYNNFILTTSNPEFSCFSYYFQTKTMGAFCSVILSPLFCYYYCCSESHAMFNCQFTAKSIFL